MGRVREHIESLAGSVFGLAIMACYMLALIGWLFWIWTAIQVGSFGMFVVGLIPPIMLIAMILGAWSLIFGFPEWIKDMFF